MRKFITAFIVMLTFGSLLAQAQQAAPKEKAVDEQSMPVADADTIIEAGQLKEVVISANAILGSKHAVLSRTGSAYYVSPEELKKFSHTDPNRILATIPGVNVFEEDGIGLRPNISLRGSAPSRSSKITIMEDGILAAPAPYASPAAYYFPTIGRMDAVEVLKGSSQIQYGPFTTGGAINFVSAQIPTTFLGHLETSYGTFNTLRGRATVGNSYKYVGYVVDYTKITSDGFKKIDNGGKSGYDINDFVAKLRLNTDMSKNWVHALELKFQYSNEVSNETYLGLTKDDYKASPYRRYTASDKDKMTTNHKQYAATYTLRFKNSFLFTLTGYNNTFARNWYKLESAKIGADAPKLDKVLLDPTKYSNFVSLLRGETDNLTGALAVKANNRSYTARGIQAKADYHFVAGETFNDIEVGVRLHSDSEDRFQWVDNYNMIAKTMVLNKSGVHGSDANRIIKANALAGYVLYKLRYKNLYVTPGIRYEHITLEQKDYGKKDPERKGGADLKTTENKVGGTFIPGIGVNYRVIKEVALFGGVHRGFAPPGVKQGSKPENSINYELGARFTLPNFYAEVGGFFNQYSNMLGSDLNATGGTGTLDLLNFGAADVNGLEFLANYNFEIKNVRDLRFPISLAYTLTNTKFRNEFKSEAWGDVKKGDEIPYIAKHQLSANLGVEYRDILLNANLRYSSGFRTQAGTGTIAEEQKAGNSVVCDIVAKYALTRNVSLSLAANNLFNQTYLASLSPYGLRPGMPRTIMGGLSVKF